MLKVNDSFPSSSFITNSLRLGRLRLAKIHLKSFVDCSGEDKLGRGMQWREVNNRLSQASLLLTVTLKCNSGLKYEG